MAKRSQRNICEATSVGSAKTQDGSHTRPTSLGQRCPNSAASTRTTVPVYSSKGTKSSDDWCSCHPVKRGDLSCRDVSKHRVGKSKNILRTGVHRKRAIGFREQDPLKPRPWHGCSVKTSPCESGKPCLTVEYRQSIDQRIPTELTYGWYLALEPRSYDMPGDTEGQGVYWCQQKACSNFVDGAPNFARILDRRRLAEHGVPSCFENRGCGQRSHCA